MPTTSCCNEGGGGPRRAVRWLDGRASAACAVCQGRATRLVAEVDGGSETDVSVERCGDCGSVRLVGPELDFSATDRAVDDYVEGGAGLDVIALDLSRVRRDAVRRFLDVGCYYGFGVHLGQHLFGWEAVGVEPSAAGERGRAELGVDIRSGFLDALPDLGTFDLVLASEVVEHVTEPVALLSTIREHLSPGGLVVLTTPAAEVVAPATREAEVVHALSPGHHRYLASKRGLEMLLERSGFCHRHVVRRGSTLDAIAAATSRGVASMVDKPVLDQRDYLRYLDRAASRAPRGSALANGMASRHLRTAVMQGDYDAATESLPRARDAMLTRRGFDLDDPSACAEGLRTGLRCAWNLAGAAYSLGMLELVARDAPERAASYFDLGAHAAVAWTELSGTTDTDTWNLRELSLGHLCLALARSDAGASVRALDRLADVLDGTDPADARRIGWWRTRTLNELVARGVLDVEPDLLAAVGATADDLARSEDADYRRAGLDALFLLGIRELNTGSPSSARGWFGACATACALTPDADGGHARRLAADALAHDAIAAERGGASPSGDRPPGDAAADA